MVLSADEQHVFINVTERPEVAARTQDVPQYVTESTYTEMANGRTNVGDSQSRRLLAILDLKQNKVTWADGSAFAGKERTAKPADTAPAASSTGACPSVPTTAPGAWRPCARRTTRTAGS